MLILTRRIGTEAPPDVSIYREEIYQRILKERADGTGSPAIPEFKNSKPKEIAGDLEPCGGVLLTSVFMATAIGMSELDALGAFSPNTASGRTERFFSIR